MKTLYLCLGLIPLHAFPQDNLKTTVEYININVKSAKLVAAIAYDTRPKVLMKRNGVYISAYINNIPSAVMGDFVSTFDGAGDVIWKVEDKVVICNFSLDNERWGSLTIS